MEGISINTYFAIKMSILDPDKAGGHRRRQEFYVTDTDPKSWLELRATYIDARDHRGMQDVTFTYLEGEYTGRSFRVPINAAIDILEELIRRSSNGHLLE